MRKISAPKNNVLALLYMLLVILLIYIYTVLYICVFLVTGCLSRDTPYVWGQGLCGVPDVPHAVNVSDLKTEGNGVGVLKEPPVSVRSEDHQADGHGDLAGNHGNLNGPPLAGAQVASSLSFQVVLTDCMMVTWETLLLGSRLIVEIPNGILPEGSKER